MNFPANPPAWLKGREIRNAWHRVFLRCDGGTIPAANNRAIELLRDYIEAVSKLTFRIYADIEEIADRVDLLSKPFMQRVYGQDVRVKMREALHKARDLNRSADSAYLLARASETELLQSMGRIDPELRGLIRETLQAGNPLLKERDSGRSIKVKSKR